MSRELHWQPATVGQRHDLGVASATRAAHGLLAALLRGIGGTLMHHHMRAIDESDPAFGAARQPAQQSLPNTLPSQALIPAIDRAPGTKVIRQVTPRSCISQPVEQSIKHHVQSCWRSAAKLQGTIFLSRSLSGPHHAKRCVFIDFTLLHQPCRFANRQVFKHDAADKIQGLNFTVGCDGGGLGC
jgi:hypothetical protein